MYKQLNGFADEHEYSNKNKKRKKFEKKTKIEYNMHLLV